MIIPRPRFARWAQKHHFLCCALQFSGFIVGGATYWSLVALHKNTFDNLTFLPALMLFLTMGVLPGVVTLFLTNRYDEKINNHINQQGQDALINHAKRLFGIAAGTLNAWKSLEPSLPDDVVHGPSGLGYRLFLNQRQSDPCVVVFRGEERLLDLYPTKKDPYDMAGAYHFRSDLFVTDNGDAVHVDLEKFDQLIDQVAGDLSAILAPVRLANTPALVPGGMPLPSPTLLAAGAAMPGLAAALVGLGQQAEQLKHTHLVENVGAPVDALIQDAARLRALVQHHVLTGPDIELVEDFLLPRVAKGLTSLLAVADDPAQSAPMVAPFLALLRHFSGTVDTLRQAHTASAAHDLHTAAAVVDTLARGATLLPLESLTPVPVSAVS